MMGSTKVQKCDGRWQIYMNVGIQNREALREEQDTIQIQL